MKTLKKNLTTLLNKSLLDDTKKLGLSIDEVIKKPEFLIVAGANGSGKTTLINAVLTYSWGKGLQYISPDIIANEMGDWNDSKLIVKAAIEAESRRNNALLKQESFLLETVFSSKDKIKLVEKAKELGYFIRMFYISTGDPRINAARVANRVMNGGHTVPIEKIISRYYKSHENLLEVMPLIDRLYLYDNSTGDLEKNMERPMVTIRDNQTLKFYTNNHPSWINSVVDMIDCDVNSNEFNI